MHLLPLLSLQSGLTLKFIKTCHRWFPLILVDLSWQLITSRHRRVPKTEMCIYSSELRNMNLHNSLKETTNSLNMSWQHHCSWEEGYLHWKKFFCIYFFSVLICSNIQILYVKKKKTHRHYDLMFCVLAFQQNKRFSNPKYTTEDIHRT